jgi:hypothetical protein
LALALYQDYAAPFTPDGINGDQFMKIRYIYKVVRDSECEKKDLAEEIDFFQGAMKDETGEYLYGGVGDDEISVEMHISEDDGITWAEVI